MSHDSRRELYEIFRLNYTELNIILKKDGAYNGVQSPKDPNRTRTSPSSEPESHRTYAHPTNSNQRTQQPNTPAKQQRAHVRGGKWMDGWVVVGRWCPPPRSFGTFSECCIEHVCCRTFVERRAFIAEVSYALSDPLGLL